MAKIDPWKQIRLVVLDVDGVLTDGRIVLHSDGTESNFFHVRDGAGIKFLLRAGLEVAFLSGRSSPLVVNRAREAGVKEVIQGAKQKLEPFLELLERKRLSLKEACYFGDDLVDLPILRRVGVSATVPEAPLEVKRVCKFVSRHAGGQGAVRELAEKLLRAQGKWAGILRRYV